MSTGVVSEEIQTLATYILNNISVLLYKDFITEIFFEIDRIAVEEVNADNKTQLIIRQKTEPYRAQLVLYKDKLHSVRTYTEIDSETYAITTDETNIINKPILANIHDVFYLHPGQIKSYKEKDSLLTTLGLLIFNYVVLTYPFDGIVPYYNKDINGDKLESLIAEYVIRKEVTAEQLNKYTRCFVYLSNIADVCVPGLTTKTLTTHPDVEKRKKELMIQYKDRLEAGDPVAMSLIEKELISLDKEWLDDDPSLGFLNKSPGKSFDIQRKKMLVVGGIYEEFGEKGKFRFIPEPLTDGIQAKNLETVANEIRLGSYSRAMETADGGVDSKWLTRVFQNVRIIEEDCGNPFPIPLLITEETYKLYENKYIIENGHSILMSLDSLKKRIGSTVLIRSPMGCRTQNGLCYNCMGENFRTLNTKSITTQALIIGSYFLMLSMKKAHGVSFDIYTINSFNKFIL